MARRRPYGQRRPYGSVKARKTPGRPTSGYFRWMIANRSRLRRENPYLNVLNLMRTAGREWRSMLPWQKQPWEDQATQARRQYNDAVRARQAAAAAAALAGQAAPATPGQSTSGTPNPAAPTHASGAATTTTPANGAAGTTTPANGSAGTTTPANGSAGTTTPAT